MKNELREYSIQLIENYYCDRMTELVEDEQFDDAHSIFEEFVISDDSSEYQQWTFIPYLQDVR